MVYVFFWLLSTESGRSHEKEHASSQWGTKLLKQHSQVKKILDHVMMVQFPNQFDLKITSSFYIHDHFLLEFCNYFQCPSSFIQGRWYWDCSTASFPSRKAGIFY